MIKTGSANPRTLRILVADDHEVVRQGVRAVLEKQAGWEVCDEAASGREAVDKAKALRPDILVLDIAMPELNGLDATRLILKALPDARVLILTMHESEQVVREVFQAGARGYVLKSDAGRDLVAAVNALLAGKPFFTTSVGEIVLEGYLQGRSPGSSPKTPHERLTPREREIFQLLAEGRTSKEIATTLGMSVKTAETHRTNIMRKLDLHSVGEVVRYAIRNKIIDA
jgi:DNA-binding NarL/FixJ family response regulator